MVHVLHCCCELLLFEKSKETSLKHSIALNKYVYFTFFTFSDIGLNKELLHKSLKSTDSILFETSIASSVCMLRMISNK